MPMSYVTPLFQVLFSESEIARYQSTQDGVDVCLVGEGSVNEVLLGSSILISMKQDTVRLVQTSTCSTDLLIVA